MTTQAEREARRLEKIRKEKERTHLLYVYEREQRVCASFIAGVDEVGRGPLAGPVVAAAVILPSDYEITGLNDSKKLSEKRREAMDEIIRREAVSFGIGLISQDRIDEINILQATYEAMRLALEQLSPAPDMILADAVTIPGIETRQLPIIKGDAKSASIAAASIIAKVYRDHLMIEYDSLYPEYGFARNKGYGTKEHINALKEFGPTPLHRKSFIGHFV
ncbi:MAG: ribonuclease HII [Lachnospiraceae bacterium]|nr:ribonuclease HII [Lachnospiraceae bacterium]MBQ6311946.1 ribonuclease HII [Lachnospiraceae bacterium]